MPKTPGFTFTSSRAAAIYAELPEGTEPNADVIAEFSAPGSDPNAWEVNRAASEAINVLGNTHGAIDYDLSRVSTYTAALQSALLTYYEQRADGASEAALSSYVDRMQDAASRLSQLCDAISKAVDDPGVTDALTRMRNTGWAYVQSSALELEAKAANKEPDVILYRIETAMNPDWRPATPRSGPGQASVSGHRTGNQGQRQGDGSADVTRDVTGDLTGNVTGDVTGDGQGGAPPDLTSSGEHSGQVDVPATEGP